jgi:hypothetical protein
MGQRIHAETGIYEAAGYERVGERTLMVRPLTQRVAQLGDERAALIEDAATEDRVVSAILATGGSEHPTRSGHVADPTIRQRWISVGGEPASFGRIVLLGNHAYLGDMATLPAFRRRGHATASASSRRRRARVRCDGMRPRLHGHGTWSVLRVWIPGRDADSQVSDAQSLIVSQAPAEEPDHETTGFGDEIDEHWNGQEEGQEKVYGELVPSRTEARVDIGRVIR